jgi:glycosyltransferase involved in cell wall biosynthesis
LNARPEVSVVIPSRIDRVDLLERALRALEAQVFKDFEVIVVLDRRSPAVFEKIAGASRLLDVSVIVQRGRGVVGARNTGVLASRGDIIVFLDDDHLPSPTWLSTIVATFRLSRRIGGVGYRVIQLQGSDGSGPSRMRKSLLRGLYRRMRERLELHLCPLLVNVNSIAKGRVAVVPHFRGALAAFRREALESIAPVSGVYFDENLEGDCLGDWLDISVRVAREYYLVYNPHAVVYHVRHEKHITLIKGSKSVKSQLANLSYILTKHARGRLILAGCLLTLAFDYAKFLLIPNTSLHVLTGMALGVKKGLQLRGMPRSGNYSSHGSQTTGLYPASWS